MSKRVRYKTLMPRQIIGGVSLPPNVAAAIKAEAAWRHLSLSQLSLRRGEVTSQE